MNYNEILEEKAKQGFDKFIDFIREDNNLLYETDEYNDYTEIEVSIFDNDEGSDFIGRYYFDENGDYKGEF